MNLTASIASLENSLEVLNSRASEADGEQSEQDAKSKSELESGLALLRENHDEPATEVDEKAGENKAAEETE